MVHVDTQHVLVVGDLPQRAAHRVLGGVDPGGELLGNAVPHRGFGIRLAPQIDMAQRHRVRFPHDLAQLSAAAAEYRAQGVMTGRYPVQSRAENGMIQRPSNAAHHGAVEGSVLTAIAIEEPQQPLSHGRFGLALFGIPHGAQATDRHREGFGD
ncbi:hypothetical protein GCM10010326_08690 [Streptomyces xanthochromogenes]|uniref:Uncharacterized protein n=1 Tax=Streptomyces xanthochromogenes TaxID=67384 RepID=A0ABQ2ZJU0_9ACTN|nr:hypothetical protein GCM10010326_08690 [Streptomyces xanthochromogenes]